MHADYGLHMTGPKPRCKAFSDYARPVKADGFSEASRPTNRSLLGGGRFAGLAPRNKPGVVYPDTLRSLSLPDSFPQNGKPNALPAEDLPPELSPGLRVIGCGCLLRRSNSLSSSGVTLAGAADEMYHGKSWT